MLKLRGGRMSYMKLIKLLYLADREALLRWGRPVTTDRYISMDHGPVLSKVLDLINEGQKPGVNSVWADYISEPSGYEVSLRNPAFSKDELSPAEEILLGEVFEKYGRLSRWDLVDLLHELPEWQDPNGGAVPIGVADILRAGRKSPSEISAIEEELDSLAMAESLVPPR